MQGTLKAVTIISGALRVRWQADEEPRAFRFGRSPSDETTTTPVSLDDADVAAMLAIAERLTAATVATLTRIDPAAVELDYSMTHQTLISSARRWTSQGELGGPLTDETTTRILKAAGLPYKEIESAPFPWLRNQK